MTAIDWLANQLKKQKDGADMYQFCIDIEALQIIIDASKIVEKEQIKEAYVSGFDDLTLSAEGYYNKYFTKK